MRGRHVVGLVLAAILVLLMACSSEPEIPACIPIDGRPDPCEGDISGEFTGSSDGEMRVSGSFGDRPFTIQQFIEGDLLGPTGDSDGVLASHIVVRGHILPNTIRCTQQYGYRFSAIVHPDSVYPIWALNCYGDIQVAEYLVGTGPPVLAVELSEWRRWQTEPDPPPDADERRKYMEAWANALTGVETVLFLGPAFLANVEALSIRIAWDLERQEDGSVAVVHPLRDYWEEHDTYQEGWQQDLVIPMASYRQRLQAAHQVRLAAYSGRIGLESDLPMLVTDAARLHDYYIDSEDVEHSDGPPIPVPESCNTAVPDPANNFNLMQDCIVLLEDVDGLRGTGALNWSVDTAIGSWDGVTVAGTPQRVTKLELANRSLTGSIPAALAKLDLATLKLEGNSLTGCIPVGLQEVAVNDLDTLNLLYCSPPPPAPTAWAVGETTFSVTWPAIANTSRYRLEHRVPTAKGWTTVSDAIADTEYFLDGIQCATEYWFRLSALGSGTVYAAAWSDPWEEGFLTTACMTPVFGEESYAFRVPESRPVGHFVVRTTATDPNGDRVTYRITSGNDDGLFTIKAATGAVLLAKTLDYETTASYTLTVEARDGNGGVGRTTVMITVTDVAE